MDNLRAAFDGIRAEERLKQNTLLFLQKERAVRSGIKSRRAPKLLAAVLASLLFFSGIYAYHLYFTPNAYVDVDVNPSFELTVNRFDRVIGTHAYNADGADILSQLTLRHQDYETAILLLLEYMDQKGYMRNDGLISVTLRTDSREDKMLAGLQTGVTNYVTDHHGTAQVDVFPISEDIREHAREQDISPAKYLAIQELMAIDPAANMESCKDHSLDEIKQMTREHGNNHHEAEPAEIEEPVIPGAMETPVTPTEATTGHHGRGHGGKHR